MIKDRLQELTDDLAQTFEEAQNTLQYSSQTQLMRYIHDKNWASKQYNARGKFKINLLGLANKELKAINQKYEKSFRIGLKKTNTPISDEALARLEAIKKENARMMLLLTKQVYAAHNKFIARIEFNSKGEYEIGGLDRTNAIYNQICEVMSSKEAQKEYKVMYKDGKQFTFKSYMEMNARTTLNQEIAEQQMESAVNNGDVFWLCNCFEDCRPQHIPWQGKVYYDERYREMGFNEKMIQKIEQAIAERQMVSRQSVENADPWLGSSPNCRHEFAAVPIEDVISMSDTQLLKNNNMIVAHATEQKYQLSQEQRMYERKIREYKARIENSKDLLEKAPKGSDTSGVQATIQHDKEILNKYYKKVRTLVNNNDFLTRNYDRESVKKLTEDLGAKKNSNTPVPMTKQQTQKALDELTEISRQKSGK